MSTPRYARSAASLIARATDGEPAAPTPESRARAIRVLEGAIGKRAEGRRRTRYLSAVVAGTSLAAATLFFAGGRPNRPPPTPAAAQPPSIDHKLATETRPPEAVTVVAHPVAGGVHVIAAGGPAKLADGATLGEGSRVVAAADGRALLSFSTGTRLTVEEGGDLTIVGESETELFTLSGGSLRAEVAKLGAGQRFVVRTRDAEVEVRGTSFRLRLAPVDVRCGTSTTTRLTVFEGVVVVRASGGESRVAAGQSWPPGCATSDNDAGSPPRTAPASGVRRDRHDKLDPTSTLAAQNDAFARAMAAKRRGAADEALAGFDRFLALYPGSALAESAIVEKMRLLASRDRPGAVVVAKQYLAYYPTGFARAEAESLAGSP